MKKTFKPMARTEKASQMYRKKTLNVNDDLDIKYDDDNIENVDAYWSTAVSVIGNQTIDFMDDTVISEQSDTLFDLKNIRQSVRSGDKEASSVSYPYKKTVDDTMKQPVKSGSENVASKKRLTLKAEGNSSDGMGDTSNSDEKENTDAGVPQLPKEKAKREETPSAPDSDEAGAGSDTVQHGGDLLAPDESHGPSLFNELESCALENRLQKAENESASTDSDSGPQKIGRKAERIDFEDSEFEKAHRNSHSIIVQDVRSVATLNKIRPVVCTEKINTAIMELDYLAYIDRENSDKAFSVFVIKGKIEIEIENKKNIIKKGEATVIEEGDVYSMSCLSKNGAALFLSYAL